MITVVKGDLFASNAQTWVNTVNCVGVMGKGVALGFKKRFPEMFKDYVRRCDAGSVKLGEPYLFKPLVPPWVLNFPTKDHWRSVARLSDIVAGLDYLEEHYKEWGIESLAVPPLGCGEGQLDWRVVGPTLYRRLSQLDVDVELYAPFTATPEEMQPEFLDGQSIASASNARPRVDPSSVALVAVLRLVERETFRWPVGRILFQKLAYFATEAGLRTGLIFQRGSYGPFAEDLKRLQTRLVNNGLIVEERNRQMFEVRTGPTYADAVEAFRPQLEEWRPMIERAADLLLRTSTRRAEVLATAHFAARELEARSLTPSEEDVVESVLRWKVKRKPPLDRQEVAEAVRVLNLLGWIRTKPSEGLERELDFAELVG